MSGDFSWRATAVCCLVASMVVLAWLARIRLLREDVATDTIILVLRRGFAYLALGLVTRFIVQQHRSRWQIVVLLLVVASIEISRLHRGNWRRGGSSWVVGSAAVSLGVLMAKWVLEPGAISEFFARHLGAIWS